MQRVRFTEASGRKASWLVPASVEITQAWVDEHSAAAVKFFGKTPVVAWEVEPA